jgi:hypothetical protein
VRRTVPCSVCGNPRFVSDASLAPGKLTCQACRRKRRQQFIKPAESVPAKRKLTTTERGLGRMHQVAVEVLKRQHVDGSPCEWCGRPMYLDRTRNWDYSPTSVTSGKLHADHSVVTRAASVELGIPFLPPDRLLHGRCNMQRGDVVSPLPDGGVVSR